MHSQPLETIAAEHARTGNHDLLLKLIKEGLPVNQRDAKGNTLLMLAAYHGHAETVDKLLKAGAGVDVANDKGQTPLGGVAFKGYVEIAKRLLEAGADPLADQGGVTPADLAVTFGRHEILELLRTQSTQAARPTRWFSKFIGWLRR